MEGHKGLDYRESYTHFQCKHMTSCMQLSHIVYLCEKCDAGMHTTLPTPPPAPPTLLEGPRPHCLALWRQSQQLKLHHTSGHHHGPHVHLSFLQEGIIVILPQPRGRRHCVWLNLRGGVRCPLPLPLPLLFDTILLDGG